MILRIRSRDGTDRITVPDAASATVGDLQRLIAERVTVPVHLQRLSLDPALLLPQAATAAAPPPLLSDPAARLASLNLTNGSFVYLSYPSDARSSQPPPPPKGLSPAGSFGKKMTMDDLIARQIRVTRQEAPLCAAASFDRAAANAFQSMRWPKLFWISACAPLASVIISTLLVFLFKAQNHGISIIGQLKCGLNRPSWDKLLFDTTYLGLTMKTGLITGIISLTEGVAVGRTFASLKDYQVDGNKEMMAIGLMNIVGSCTSCYVTIGAFSRSAMNHNAGCKTAMSNVIMALTVMVTLLFLMPLFVYTPNVVLGAIIIAVVIGLIDLPAAYHIWKMDKMDFLVCLCAFAGVIFISVQEGLAIAVGISIFRVLLQVTRPKMMIQGNIKGTDIYRNLHQYKEAQRVPGFLILALEAPINFANTNYLNKRIKRWIEEENSSGNKQNELHFVILDLSAVPAIDTSGIAFLIDIKKSIEIRGLELVLVNPTGEVMEKIQRANDAHNHFRSDCLYLTTEEAIASLSAFTKMTTP